MYMYQFSVTQQNIIAKKKRKWQGYNASFDIVNRDIHITVADPGFQKSISLISRTAL